MPDGLTNPNLSIRSLLARHQRRREQGLPTLSLLVGPPEHALAAWADWAESAGRNVLVCHAVTELDIAGQLLRGIARNTDLTDAALAWVGSSSANRFFLSRARIGRMTRQEFNDFWHAFVDALAPGPPALLVQRILTSTLHETDGVASLEAFVADFPQHGRASRLKALFKGLVELLGVSGMPAFISIPSVRVERDCQQNLFGMLADLLVSESSLSFALQISSTELTSFRQAEPESRALALLREGCIELELVDMQSPRSAPGAPSSAVPVSTSQYLARIGASAKASSLLAEAACCLETANTANEDRARSAAERFLFEVLESLPATAGRFRLNQRLEFLHGSHPAEGDLVAPDARVAVELDGRYYHLSNADAYRRDRQKDYSYQRHGYLILRFLSEDVVARLEAIVHTITEALTRSGHEP